MEFKYSSLGDRLTRGSGIQELMHDLGSALSESPDMLMLGGGNPAAIPEVQAIWRRRMQEILDDPAGFDAMLGNYDTPQGRPVFMDALCDFLNQRYGWGLTRKNITITNGSQNAFFYLFNMLAGSGRKILLPLSPEYIGYADQGLEDGLFVSCPARIEKIGERSFKYRIDFDRLEIDDSIGAICVSRPTNPSGNVITDDELRRLRDLAKQHGIPLIVDSAYGAPFPHIIFQDVTPMWDESMVVSLSLSKLGLPGTRTGILIANEEITRGMGEINAVVNLANGNIGQEIVAPMLVSGEIETVSREIIQPFYAGKAAFAKEKFASVMPQDVPWRLHANEGSMFFWCWIEGLSGGSAELYRRLKERGVIVVSGHYFFYGLAEEWSHANECIRIHSAMPTDSIERGFDIIADVLKNG